ncbi:hypothetical protein [Parolsenella catena]|uniref:hypothetical protein n=1 Tax=Parolsenella catena TaxID=2003188 RepID=UPI00319E480C
MLGLSYMLFFKGSPLYGTIGILIMVNLVHFFASPYLMAYNALNKLNGSLESVGQTLGIPRKRMVLDVFLPQTRGTVVEMASYSFVNRMVTISAVAFSSQTSLTCRRHCSSATLTRRCSLSAPRSCPS